MADVYRTRSGGTALKFRVEVTLDMDEVVQILCRKLAKYDGAAPPQRISRTELERLVREELAFGGYDAYGYSWTDNFPGGEEGEGTFQDQVTALVRRAWPNLTEVS